MAQQKIICWANKKNMLAQHDESSWAKAQPTLDFRTVFPGDHSRMEPPDPISNSEVKHSRADDSVGFPHVKVGHCQVFILGKRLFSRFFFVLKNKIKFLGVVDNCSTLRDAACLRHP